MTKRTITISNTDDVIDSRDVIERISQLHEERTDFEHDEDGNLTGAAWSDSFGEEAAELAALEALQSEAEGYSPDWQYGATLIRDSYFKSYAQELADDIGAINANATWPNNCIDWDRAARELQMDYTSVDFDGVAYWVR